MYIRNYMKILFHIQIYNNSNIKKINYKFKPKITARSIQIESDDFILEQPLLKQIVVRFGFL